MLHIPGKGVGLVLAVLMSPACLQGQQPHSRGEVLSPFSWETITLAIFLVKLPWFLLKDSLILCSMQISQARDQTHIAVTDP